MLMPRALVTLSVDLELDLNRQGPGLEAGLEVATGRLLRVLEDFRVAATWAVADPAISAATAMIRASRLGHELGVLGDASWAGPGAGRARFSRELHRRISAARDTGLEVSSLVLRNTEIGGNLDLLQQNAIRVLRRGKTTTMAAEASPPGLLCAGVLDAPLTLRMPSFTRWDWSHGRRSAQRLLDAAVSQSLRLHLALDGAQLAERWERGVTAIARLLESCARYRELNLLEIVTLREFGDRFLPETTAARAHSVLRPAA